MPVGVRAQQPGTSHARLRVPVRVPHPTRAAGARQAEQENATLHERVTILSKQNARHAAMSREVTKDKGVKAHVKALDDKKAELQAQLEEATANKNELEAKAESTAKRLNLAQRLGLLLA